MALSGSDYGLILGKRAMGKAAGDPSKPFFEESVASSPVVLSGNVWTEAALIPATAPIAATVENNDVVSGVVKYHHKLHLTKVSGTTAAFYNSALINAIPFYWGDGSYNYFSLGIFSGSTQLLPSHNDLYILDGVLVFKTGTAGIDVDNIYISFYEYVGKNLVQSLDEAGKFQQQLNSWELDSGSVPTFEIVGSYWTSAFSPDEDTAVYTMCNLGPNYKKAKQLKLKITYRTSVASTDGIRLKLGYCFTEDTGFNTTISYTDILSTIVPTSTSNFQSCVITIPTQNTSYQLINLMLARLGTDQADVNTGKMQILSTILYQD